ncbi:IBR domain, partial [Trinorchestia longiramus]
YSGGYSAHWGGYSTHWGGYSAHWASTQPTGAGTQPTGRVLNPLGRVLNPLGRVLSPLSMAMLELSVFLHHLVIVALQRWLSSLAVRMGGAPLLYGDFSKVSVRDFNTALAGIEDHNTALPGIEDRNTALPGIEDCNTALAGIEDCNTALPGIEDCNTALPGIEDCNTALPGIEDRNTALPRIKNVHFSKGGSSSSSESEGTSLDGVERGAADRRCTRLARFPPFVGLSRTSSHDTRAASRRHKNRNKSRDSDSSSVTDALRPSDRPSSTSKSQYSTPLYTASIDLHRQSSGGGGSSPSTPLPPFLPRHSSEGGSLSSPALPPRRSTDGDSSPSTPPPPVPPRVLSQQQSACSSNSNFSPNFSSSKTCMFGPSSDAEYSASSIAAAAASAAAAADRGSLSSCSAVVLRECVLCLQDVPADQFPKLFTCSHSACITCLKQYLAMEISESRVTITCPKCSELMHPTDIHQILNNSVLSYKFEDFMLRRVLSTDPDTRWCPAPDCGYAVIATGCAGCPKLRCERPGCGSHFCYHCKAEWHPNQTCDMARGQRTPHFPYNISSSHADDDVKACPRCQVLIVKMDDGSCNHMTCSVCGAEFCWLCMKEVSDLHYLSPSGCTFWGKKPWSRKKKVMWQLGTLVGAPLGIALLAGLAVPAIIIGIPIWAGRKVHAKYNSAGRHKRNAMVVCSVMWSSLLSPVIAGVAVSIGVPILLAYVYGVVPISLCRSGGCGVITSAAGVRIAFDDEGDNNSNTNTPASAAALTAANIAMSGAAAVRSFARLNDGGGSSVSGVGSASCDGVSTESVGGVEGVGEEPDRESASNVAIAPPSLAGSIASSSCYGPRSHKLEVHVEMGSEYTSSRDECGRGMRYHVRELPPCGTVNPAADTASLAVSERSVNTPDADSASTRGLAGSVQRYKVQEEEHCSVASLSNVSNVAQAGDSASTVMVDVSHCASSVAGVETDCYGSQDNVPTTGIAAPSILSSISANTTTNLYLPEGSSCRRDGGSRNCGTGVGDDCAHGGGRASAGHNLRCYSTGVVAANDDDGTGYNSGDGGVDGTGDASDRHEPLHGSDPRLDSVSAIITARKFSTHSKGVTFSIGSASSQSRDHISLNLEDHFSETGSAASVSGVSASALSGVSASALSSVSASAASGSVGNVSTGVDRDSRIQYCASGEREEAAFMESWYKNSNENGTESELRTLAADNHNSCNTVGQSYSKACTSRSTFGQALDYREAYGVGHYSSNKVPELPSTSAAKSTATVCVNAALLDGMHAAAVAAKDAYADARVSSCAGSTSAASSNVSCISYHSEDKRLSACRGAAAAPLERHRSVPNTYECCSSFIRGTSTSDAHSCVDASTVAPADASKRSLSVGRLHS